jgi:LacI family transcriptional regulator
LNAVHIEEVMSNKRITLADVAAASGLSKTAVSLALNNSAGSRLSPEAVQRAKDAASMLNYRPNPAARTLRTQLTHSYGFLSSDIAVTSWGMAMVSGALRKSNQNDHALLISESSDDVVRQRRALEALLDRGVDGLIVAEMRARKVAAPDVPHTLPVVYANAMGPKGSISILPDEYQGGRSVADALLAGRFKSSVAIIGGHIDQETDPAESVTVGERLRGIRDALRDAGISAWNEVCSKIWTADFGFESLMGLASTDSMPDAIIALNDSIAAGIYNACNVLGIKVGEDISLVSFDDSEVVRYLRPGLTTGRLPYEEIGELAVEALLEKSELKDLILVPMPLQIRGSVAY